MKYFFLFFLACLIAAPSEAQLGSYKKEFQNYIPKGWVLDTALRGDLNKDQQADVVLVLRNTDPSNLKKNDGLGMDQLDLNPRRLLILFKTGTGYTKELASDDFLPSINDEESTCLEDPFSEGGIEISKGLLKIRLHYWLSCGSWYVTDYDYIFRYQNKKFELIGLDVSSFHRASGESSITSYNFSTRKKQTITGMNEFEETKVKPVEKWEKIKNLRLLNLAEMTGETAIEEIVNKDL
ncbi:hypothetical protein ACTJIJ_20735 [Niabella sp. 22666]|uniref:hypothetical protein n=1 Tax=Niabella sp. 22666 TaxID=3453954 RepID=UPI003F873978